MNNAPRPALIIVDDDVGFVHAAAEIAKNEGFDITIAGGFEQAVKRLQAREFDLALIDLALPDGNGLELIDHIDLTGRTQVVIITGQPTVESTLKAIRLPILDYIIKPIDVARYRELLAKAYSRCCYAPPPVDISDWHGLVGDSEALQNIKNQIERVAPTDVAVLIHGESGVGKELVARALHEVSGRGGSFVAMNCGAVPSELMASQLFGHEKGSFTGAVTRHIGYFEQAQGGTLFLDEVTEMPVHLQVHLLRTLETRAIRRVGGAEEIPVDVRIISATNREPLRAVEEGRLREDLFYRLAEFPIVVPPLRDRPEDLRLLASLFLSRLNERYGTRKAFAAGTFERLECHTWPGNVRELRNVIQRAYILSPDDVVRLQFDHPNVNAPLAETPNSLTFAVGTSFELMERKMLFKTLAYFSNDKVKTAEALGVSVKTIYNRLARYQEGAAHLTDEEAEQAREDEENAVV